jgi:dUTPase
MQMLVQKVEHMEIEESESLSETDRGEKGFGSSGK